jgi:hypothetical protein
MAWYPAPAWSPAVASLPAAAQPAPGRVTIKGKTYRIIPHPDKGNYPEDERDLAAETLPPGAAGSNIPPADRFKGTARRLPKTTVFKGPVESFDTVAALLDSLPPNDEMLGMMIAHTPTTNRVKKEQRNVRVKGYIYAFKKEADNDYHVVIGDAPGGASPRYMNAEVSGIPIAGTDENRATLWEVRNAFKSTFNLGNTGPVSYFRPDPPIPVRLTGSIFWDVDHEHPPYVGPNDFKPKTAWEIHPISKIEFLGE